jgi:hypothetical protein
VLLEELDFHPEVRGPKYVLPTEENRRLSQWQRDNLRLAWCVRERPYEGGLERRVIGLMRQPPSVEARLLRQPALLLRPLGLGHRHGRLGQALHHLLACELASHGRKCRAPGGLPARGPRR